DGQLDRAVQTAGQAASRVGEALDELPDGLLVHSPSVDIGRCGWQDHSAGAYDARRQYGFSAQEPTACWAPARQEIARHLTTAGRVPGLDRCPPACLPGSRCPPRSPGPAAAVPAPRRSAW